MRIKTFSIKSTKKFLWLSLIYSVVISIIISVIFFLSMLSSFKNEIYSNISSNEKMYTKKNVSLFDNSVDQLSTVAARFSLLPNSLIYDGSELDYLKKKYLSESMLNFKYTIEYINGIKYINKNSEDPSALVSGLENQYTLGNIGYTNISIYEDHQFPYYMYLEFSDPNSVYKYNILITVSCVDFSNEILEIDDKSTDLIISDIGTVILSSDKSIIGSNVFEFVANSSDKIESGFFEGDFAGEKSFISINKSENTNTYAVKATPISSYKTQIRNIYMRTTLLTLCFFVCTVLLCCLIVAISYKPVSLILNNCKNYFPNENNYEIFENEVDYINSNIIKTIRSHDNIADELQKNTKLLQTAQINSLQSQINPHFIFNTLDAVKWLSIDLNGISNSVEKCIVKLEQILRASIDMHNNIISFKDELSLTKSYVDLMHLRYKDLFSVKYDIDTTLENCSVIKFIMQPIIENCVKHGFAEISSGGEIEITAKNDNNILTIEISDNGCGIEPDKLAELQQNLNIKSESVSNHVGLYNVNTRIKLLYGDSFGVSVESSLGSGTKCIIRFPLE